MIKKLLLMAGWLGCWLAGRAQLKLDIKTLDPGSIGWDNYSTTYLEPGDDSVPFIVSAIPNNGVFCDAPNAPIDIAFSEFRLRSQLHQHEQQLTTYDSGDVYFLVPGIFQQNAQQYEFRVLENGKRVVKPWGPVTTFVDVSFQLNMFRSGFGFLGGFSTTFGNYLVVELRHKRDTLAFAASAVRWTDTKPKLSAVFTPSELSSRLLTVTNDFRADRDLAKMLLGTDGENKDQLPPLVPKNWVVPAGEKRLIFQVADCIYQKGALEYRVFRNGKLINNWTGNLGKNSFVWIDRPEPGNHTIELRYRKQRQHVTSYSFKVQAAWYQTWAFKIIAGLLMLASVGAVILAVKLRRQRRRTMAEQEKKVRFELGLKSVYAQLNPHFTFNALSSIQGLINSHDMKGANKYLSDFASLVRRSLADSEQKLIALQRELETLDIYLSLEKLRFNFAYTIHWDNSLPLSIAEIPALLLQPLAENAVKHGVSAIREQGKIDVEVSGDGADMIVKVTDNGAGFEPGKEVNGYGLKLTRDRIRLLNEMAGWEQIVFDIRNGPDKGTTVTIVFKKWLV